MLINDNYFSPVFGVADIGEGVQTCQGYHVSIRPSLQGLSLNLGEYQLSISTYLYQVIVVHQHLYEMLLRIHLFDF